MKIYRRFTTLPPADRVLTFGNFDGLHLGHESLIQKVLAIAREKKQRSVVVFFEPMPQEHFGSTKRLMSFHDKCTRLKSLGVDDIIALHFKTIVSLSAKDFIENFLIHTCRIKTLVIGEDCRFGHGRQGDLAVLKNYHPDFDTIVMPPIEIDGERVSSSLLRVLLSVGDFVTAEKILGSPYSISGIVKQGHQRGRTIGFPTANIGLQKTPVLHGVYAVEVRINNILYKGVANIGYRPTVANTTRPQLEVHVFDYEANLYGKRITIIFRHKIREEQKFASFEDLKNQIVIDAKKARELLG
jgi:riboflavin kinase/FMN adenylyltransferase